MNKKLIFFFNYLMDNLQDNTINDMYYKQFFVKKNEDIESNFILFKDIEMTIGNKDNIDSELYYFTINNLSVGHGYCNVDIIGENYNDENIERVRLATFYNKSNISFGIEDILNNELYLEKMKLKVDFTQRIDIRRWRMMVYVYIDKAFLLSLYETENLPKFLFKIIKEDTYRLNLKMNYNYLKTGILDSNEINCKIYKRDLFNYQKMNVKWMTELENNIINNLTINTFKLPSSYYLYNLNNINEYIISNEEGKIQNIDNLEKVSIEQYGGILCDEVGLGKTFSMLSLIVEGLNKTCDRTSLIFCPNRLCKQWIDEIEKTYNLTYKLITTIAQFKKLTVDIIKTYDVFIFSYNFLTNNNYKIYCDSNLDNPILLHNYKWNRIILDEGHEFINSSTKVKVLATRNELQKLKCNFKWICSGTPFGNLKDLKEIFNFITNLKTFNNDDDSVNLHIFRHNFDMLLNIFFRRNTKESVKEQVCIPPVVVDTEFLNMSSLERLIYDSALNNKDKQIELCNHILVSEEHLNILGNEPLTLDEIKDKMTTHYKNKIDKYEKRILKLKDEINSNNGFQDLDLSDKLQDYQNSLNDYKAKYNIFTQLEEKINQDDTCPICFEELKDLTTCITPCGHMFCSGCLNTSNNINNSSKNKCPMCRYSYKIEEVKSIKADSSNNNEPQIGTKIERLLNYINDIINKNNKEKIIVFSQWDTMLKLVSKFLSSNNVNNIVLNGSIHTISSKIRKFKLDDLLNVVLMSSDKSPSGLTLTEATHVILLDSLNTEKENAMIIENQAIGRAHRIGQTKTVNVKRFIMRNTIEHDFYIRNIDSS